MGSAWAVIALWRPGMASSLAVLEFQPGKHLSHQLVSSGCAVWPSARKHMLLPGICIVSPLPLTVRACQQAFGDLEQQVSQVKRFRSWQSRALAQCLLQLILQPHVIRRRSLQGSNRDEHMGQAHLPHTIHKCQMHGLPVGGAKDLAGYCSAKACAWSILRTTQWTC